ncbi:hypothetical protein AU189_13410 [Mycolicibacterium acapulense]|nr:hypothetical protein AU189_13410 [Mycolicibacterium acapulense]
MTAWATDNPDSIGFSGERLLEYVAEGPDEDGADGEMKLLYGLISLAGVLLGRVETATGKSKQWHLQDIARKSL